MRYLVLLMLLGSCSYRSFMMRSYPDIDGYMKSQGKEWVCQDGEIWQVQTRGGEIMSKIGKIQSPYKRTVQNDTIPITISTYPPKDTFIVMKKTTSWHKK